MKKALAILLTAVMLLGVLTACGSKKDDAADDTQNTEDTDKAAADNVAALIDAIYVQERTDETDAQCEAAKAAWDALTDEQKAMVEGEEASPEYFGLDTGDASKDDPRNQDDIGENELLVVSFGTPRFHGSDHYQPHSGPRRREDRQHDPSARPRCGQRRQEPRRAADAPDARRGV